MTLYNNGGWWEVKESENQIIHSVGELLALHCKRVTVLIERKNTTECTPNQ